MKATELGEIERVLRIDKADGGEDILTGNEAQRAIARAARHLGRSVPDVLLTFGNTIETSFSIYRILDEE